MSLDARVGQLAANYEILVALYKQGKFEEAVRTTTDPADPSKYYDAAAADLPLEDWKFARAGVSTTTKASIAHLILKSPSSTTFAPSA